MHYDSVTWSYFYDESEFVGLTYYTIRLFYLYQK